MWLGWVCGAAVVRGGRCANNVRGMSSVLLLLILAVIVDGFPQQTPASIIASNNQCIKSCPRTCSPACLPTCCSGSGVLPAQAGKPEMMVTSVEEGETEEVQGDKGFGNPDDDSCDPPGTITIPLPPTVYEPPKAGEEPKEMPLPEFKLPAAIFEGKIPSESMTLSPEGTKLPPGAKLPLETAAVSKPPPTVDLSPPAAAPLLSAPAASFPPPPPPLMIPLKTPVLMPPPPPPPAPPAPPPIAMSSGGSLPYPKLPPVTISEIPNRSNRQPPLLLPKKFGAPAPLLTLTKPEAPAISLPKPPPIHVSGEVVGANTALISSSFPACTRTCRRKVQRCTRPTTRSRRATAGTSE